MASKQQRLQRHSAVSGGLAKSNNFRDSKSNLSRETNTWPHECLSFLGCVPKSIHLIRCDSQKSHTSHLCINPRLLTVTQLGLPDRINLWHPPMAPHFLKNTQPFLPVEEKNMHNRHTEPQMQFLWTKKKIKDFNNFMDFREFFSPHQLSRNGNQGIRRCKPLSMCVVVQSKASWLFACKYCYLSPAKCPQCSWT